MKVWLVSTGAYSDFSITAVYSTEEVAEDHADRLNRANYYNYAEVHEWDVDETQTVRPGDIAFRVSYSNKNDWISSFAGRWHATGDEWKTNLDYVDVQETEPGYFSTWVWAHNEADARKKGADKIMPVLAEREIEMQSPSEPSPFENIDTPFLNMIKPITIGDHDQGEVKSTMEWGLAKPQE